MIRPGVRRLFRLPLRRMDVAERELEEEIALHIELRIERLVGEGMSPEAARAEAQRRFGPLEAERAALLRAVRRREGRAGLREWLGALRQDLTYGARQLVRDRRFAAAAIFTVALGTGANTAVFSVVDGVMLRPLPYEEPERLAAVGVRRPAEPEALGTIDYATFESWSRDARSFDGMAAYTYTVETVSGGAEPAQVWAIAATSSLLEILGVEPQHGDNFPASEDGRGGPAGVLLSDAFWRSSFGADPTIVGRTIDVEGTRREVLGILPRGFQFPPPMRVGRGAPPEIALWLPTGTLDDLYERGGFHVVGRLAPGRTVEQARGEMASFVAQLEARGESDVAIGTESLHEQVVAPVRPALLAFFGAVALVLLIACVNVGSLLLVRMTSRERELSLRASLGASRGRIARQLLTESMLLGVIGGLVGVLFAGLGLRALVAVAPPEIPRLADVRLSAHALLFTLAITIGASLFFGSLPVLRTLRGSRGSSAAGVRTTADRGIRRLHRGLVVAEIVLAVSLLMGAGLLIRTFLELTRVDLGVVPENLLTLELNATPDRYPTRADVLRYFDGVEGQLAPLPGVTAVGMIDRLPLGDYSSSIPFDVSGRVTAAGEARPVALNTAVRPGYFHAVGIPLLEGRDITAADATDAPAVVVVSRALAERVFPDGDAIGARVNAFGVEREIVGVVGDVRHHAPGIAAEPMIYFPQAQDAATRRGMTVTLRTDVPPESLAGAARAALRALDAQVPVSHVQTFHALLARRTAAERFNALVVAAFAAVALLLAAVGIYGVMSFTVAARTRELGLRMALGASSSNVMRQVLRGALATVGLGLVAGLALAVPLSFLMRSLIFGVEPADPLTIGAVAALLAGVGALAAWSPARRAAQIEPLEALRYE